MRAISVRQPWASLILDGSKTIEVRSWRIAPGPLVICASAAADRKRGKDFLRGDEPLGVTICVVDVVGVRDGRADDVARAMVDPTGYFVWELANVRPLAPVPVKGRLGVYTVDDASVVYAAIKRSA